MHSGVVLAVNQIEGAAIDANNKFRQQASLCMFAHTHRFND